MHIGIASPVTIQNIESICNIKNGTLPECVRGTNVAIIIESLIRAGNRVSIYTLSNDVNLINTYKFDSVTLHIGHYRNKHRAWDLFKKEIEAVRCMISNDTPEIVHSNWSYEFALGSLETGNPTLVTLRDWAPTIFRFLPDHYRFARLILNNMVLNKAKNFSANSPYIQNLAEKKLKRSVSLIPNPVSNKSFITTIKNYSSNQFTIISVNNGFSKYKNVPALIRAFTIVRSELPNVELWLVGDGHGDGGEAHKWVYKNKIDADKIKFWGTVYTKKLIELYDKSDLLVHPSLEESFGNTLVEAMARKVPVIAGENSGAVPWVLDSGKAGVLTNVADIKTLAESIISVLTDKYKWLSLSQSGFENAHNRFRSSEIIKLYIKEYEKTIRLYKGQ